MPGNDHIATVGVPIRIKSVIMYHHICISSEYEFITRTTNATPCKLQKEQWHPVKIWDHMIDDIYYGIPSNTVTLQQVCSIRIVNHKPSTAYWCWICKYPWEAHITNYVSISYGSTGSHQSILFGFIFI